MPLFSATNTRPFGANSIAVGVSRPEKATVCWNPGGSVVAAARRGEAQQRGRAGDQRAQNRCAKRRTRAIESNCVWGQEPSRPDPLPWRNGRKRIQREQRSTNRVAQTRAPSPATRVSRNEDALAREDRVVRCVDVPVGAAVEHLDLAQLPRSCGRALARGPAPRRRAWSTTEQTAPAARSSVERAGHRDRQRDVLGRRRLGLRHAAPAVGHAHRVAGPAARPT